ncbi:methylthioribose-1-phosphate isomerase-like [Mytilus trossulus]|uniref:methylthioribose-1-phosphate isomerase-like n=1 Tax=Mytilus trossulus TaxID=6551 RepID=UPI00300584A4
MTLEAIRYTSGSLMLLDQLLLPNKSEYIQIKNTEDGWNAIKKMQIRGAPAIAVAGCLSLAVELIPKQFSNVKELVDFVVTKLEYLVTSRPTAVNMLDAAKLYTARMTEYAKQPDLTPDVIKNKIVTEIEQMLEDDVNVNKRMGQYGGEDILSGLGNSSATILTHCNTGSLATAGYGTALGVVRYLQSKQKLDHVYCTETRPYNQGARLTAYEIVYEKMPGTLICDSMVAMLMKKNKISAVIVGADRVVANGDAANKIGTYQIAIVAKHHGVPFYVACPSTTYDDTLPDGDHIVIEERPHGEMTSVNGTRIAAPGIGCWNPAFDVTPGELITGGIITEFGVFKPSELQQKIRQAKSK